MTDIDFSKIKVGDWVGATVIEVYPDGAVRIDTGFPHRGGALIAPSAIVSHTPAPRPALKVGDRVRDAAFSDPRDVGFIDGAYVYFRPRQPGNMITPFPLSEVEQWERV